MKKILFNKVQSVFLMLSNVLFFLQKFQTRIINRWRRILTLIPVLEVDISSIISMICQSEQSLRGCLKELRALVSEKCGLVHI